MRDHTTEKIIESVRRDMYRFIEEYSTKFPDHPVTMRMLSQKYAKRMKPTGMTIKELAENDPVYTVVLTKGGGFNVVDRRFVLGPPV